MQLLETEPAGAHLWKSLPPEIVACDTYSQSHSSVDNLNKKAEYRKDNRAMLPIYGCSENFRVPEYAHGYFSGNF